MVDTRTKLVTSLKSFLCSKHNVTEIDKHVVTHGADIIIVADKAYKIKKPVNFPYMDYSSPEKRLDMCKKEVELNKRTAPHLYANIHGIIINKTESDKLELVPITDDNQTFIDYVIEMNRFDNAKLLANLADEDELPLDIIPDLTHAIFDLHEKAESFADVDNAQALLDVVAGNEFCCKQYDFLDKYLVAKVNRLCEAGVNNNKSILQQRQKLGLVKYTHGDLHLSNIYLDEHNKPVLFDCIEFNPVFAITDTLYDLAFLVMDLNFRGYKQHANLLLNQYISLYDPDLIYRSLALLPMLMAIRATIRCHVNAAMGNLELAKKYLYHALAYFDQEEKPLIYVVAGLSGSGKTNYAHHLAINNNAFVISSDVIRHHLCQGDYSPDANLLVYQKMIDLTKYANGKGHNIILDATFLRNNDRKFIDLLPYTTEIFWLNTPDNVAEKWLEARKHGFSEADNSIREQQKLHADSQQNTEWQCVNTVANLMQIPMLKLPK
jgi:aminoglycoside phosphotransferase family enzyme/predicted kinase